ncbi:Ammonium Transporter Family [Priestia flexa]|nr:Ammonium Transporter Family [Priestia flexa]
MMAATNWLEARRIDDPVGAFPVHAAAGVWGTIAVGLFATDGGLFFGGGFELLGIQFIGLVALSARGFLATWFGLKAIALLIPLRSTEEEEEVGLDISYHGIMAANQSHEFIEYYNQYEQTEQK